MAARARLPTQRSLAEALGVDFTTVTRAYAEAARRGLVEGQVGKGTFVKSLPAERRAVGPGVVDLTMNLPPRLDNPELEGRLWSGIGALQAEGGSDLLSRYQPAGGAPEDRAAGAIWLSDRLPGVTADRVLVCPGAQGAALAVVGLLANPGDVICAEALTYPGVKSLAGLLRLKLAPVEMDQEGVIPGAFDAVCRQTRPKALYCTPTLHNPTTATMSVKRREAIVQIARAHEVAIVEDDAYGKVAQSLPPLAALAPDRVFHIATLSKGLSPALRIAYLVAPAGQSMARVVGALRASASMTSPLTSALANRWIREGTAQDVLAAIKAEAAARQRLAGPALASYLPVEREGFHIWLRLPAPWSRAEFIDGLRGLGIGVVGSDAFALTEAPEAVRLGLGASRTREDLRAGLRIVADLLEHPPAAFSTVV